MGEFSTSVVTFLYSGQTTLQSILCIVRKDKQMSDHCVCIACTWSFSLLPLAHEASSPCDSRLYLSLREVALTGHLLSLLTASAGTLWLPLASAFAGASQQLINTPLHIQALHCRQGVHPPAVPQGHQQLHHGHWQCGHQDLEPPGQRHDCVQLRAAGHVPAGAAYPLMLLLADVCGVALIAVVAGNGNSPPGAAVGCKFVRTRCHKGTHDTCLAYPQHGMHCCEEAVSLSHAFYHLFWLQYGV